MRAPEHAAGHGLAQLAAIVEASDDAIICVTPEGEVVTWNSGAEGVFGYSAAEMLGCSVSALSPGDRAAEALALRQKVQQGETIHGYETVGRRKDGQAIPVSLTASPIRDEAGRVIGIFAVVRDITAQKRLEHELRTKNVELARQNRKVEEANRVKNEFLANMSHELRSPLNGIIGFAELMHDGKLGPVSEQHKEYLADILSSGKHLLQLINDVLDVARIESGRVEFRPEPVLLSRLVREVVDVLHAIAVEKGVTVRTDVPADLDAATLDPARFKQVLYNYLSNALKFTPDQGRVEVRIRPDGLGCFRLEVEDTGIGVPPEEIPKLFAQFRQVESSAARRFQGSGLGLALTRRIVEAQGGAVGVASELGEGSLFYATLPRVAGTAAHKRKPAVRAAGTPG